MGCASRALEPQRTITSVCSTSRKLEVPPPAPKTVARPTTLGACQVLFQLSMLFLPTAARKNFCAAEVTSLVALEQLKMPNVLGPCCLTVRLMPSAARVRASSQVAGRSLPPSRTRGSVSRGRRDLPFPFERMGQPYSVRFIAGLSNPARPVLSTGRECQPSPPL